jgi:hypothetical protein
MYALAAVETHELARATGVYDFFRFYRQRHLFGDQLLRGSV